MNYADIRDFIDEIVKKLHILKCNSIVEGFETFNSFDFGFFCIFYQEKTDFPDLIIYRFKINPQNPIFLQKSKSVLNYQNKNKSDFLSQIYNDLVFASFLSYNLPSQILLFCDEVEKNCLVKKETLEIGYLQSLNILLDEITNLVKNQDYTIRPFATQKLLEL